MTPHYSIDDIARMAAMASKSGLFRRKTKDAWVDYSPEELGTVMMLAAADGYHPMRGILDYDIIPGRKPSLKAEAMLARFQANGGTVRWLTYTDTECSAEFSSASSPAPVRITWSIERASRVTEAAWVNGRRVERPITEKPVWVQFPAAMLRSRVVSEGIRTVLPAAVLGYYTAEEQDAFAPPARNGVEPIPTPEPEPEPESDNSEPTPATKSDRMAKRIAPPAPPAPPSDKRLMRVVDSLQALGFQTWNSMRTFLHHEFGEPDDLEKLGDVAEDTIAGVLERFAPGTQDHHRDQLINELRSESIRPDEVQPKASEWADVPTPALFTRYWKLLDSSMHDG